MTETYPSSAAVVEAFFDAATSTFSYLVLDPASRRCAVIDSVLGYDPASGRTDSLGAERLIARIRELDARLEWILETHAHADHFSAAPILKAALGGRTGIGRHITQVQQTFGKLFNAGSDFATDGRQFDHLFEHGEAFSIGSLQASALHTPGHTPACMTYVVANGEDEAAAFVGDTLFMPDYGSARCDFPGGDAATLYRSIRRVLSLPADTRLHSCHDYPPGGREPRFASSVADQRAHNVHVHDGVDEASFVAMRHRRDATLGMPQLLLPAVQVNMRAGEMPPPEGNGVRYLKIPLDTL